jgi:hypothetical protein
VRAPRNQSTAETITKKGKKHPHCPHRAPTISAPFSLRRRRKGGEKESARSCERRSKGEELQNLSSSFFLFTYCFAQQLFECAARHKKKKKDVHTRKITRESNRFRARRSLPCTAMIKWSRCADLSDVLCPEHSAAMCVHVCNSLLIFPVSILPAFKGTA